MEIGELEGTTVIEDDQTYLYTEGGEKVNTTTGDVVDSDGTIIQAKKYATSSPDAVETAPDDEPETRRRRRK